MIGKTVSLGYGVTLICAALMGFAIQRRITFAVAAVGEISQSGRCTKLVVLTEAALCVSSFILLAKSLGFVTGTSRSVDLTI